MKFRFEYMNLITTAEYKQERKFKDNKKINQFESSKKTNNFSKTRYF